MVKFDKLSKVAKQYKFVATEQPNVVINHIKQKYERLALVLEQYRTMLDGEEVSKTTFSFDSKIEMAVAFGLVDQRLQSEFQNPYNKYVRSDIDSKLSAGRTMMSVIYKSSFVSKKYNPDVIFANTTLRMYFSSLYHWCFYNGHYDLAEGWRSIYTHLEYPNTNNLPKTTKLIKKVVKLFEGMPEHAQLLGRFHDVLTSSASGQLQSEKVYITIDFTEMLQCSHHTATPWRSCYALDKQYPYSSFYMASHPDTAMLYTVDSNGKKTFRTWVFLHPKGFALNREAWPNGSTATNTKRDSLFNQLKTSMQSTLGEDGFTEDLDLVSASGRISTSHEVYKQFAQGGGRSNQSFYKTGSDFFNRHESFYRTVTTHKYFRFNNPNANGYPSHGSLSQRDALTEAQLADIKVIEAALVKYRTDGVFGPSQLVLMLQAMDPIALEFFKEGIRNQHGADVFDAAYAEAFPTTVVATDATVEETIVEEVLEDAIAEVIDTPATTEEIPDTMRAQEVPTLTETPEPAPFNDEIYDGYINGTHGGVVHLVDNSVPEADIADVSGAVRNVQDRLRLDEDNGETYLVPQSDSELIRLTPRRHYRVEGDTPVHNIIGVAMRDTRFGAILLDDDSGIATIHDEVTITLSADAQSGAIAVDTETQGLSDTEREYLGATFDEVYIDEAVAMEDEIVADMTESGEVNE